MIRSKIRNLIRKRLGETTSAFWTDVELNDYINLGCKDISWRLKCLRDSGSIGVSSCVATTVAEASTEFTISDSFSDFYAINEVYFKREAKDYVRLIPSSREELDVLNYAWQSMVGYTHTNTASGVVTYNYESETSEPTHYYWSREEDVLGIHPPPNDDQEGSSLKVYYSKEHTDLSSDDASPTIPTGVHLAVVDFGVATGLEDRGWGDRANDMWNKYFTKLKDYTTEKKNEREDDDIIMKNYRNV